MTRLTNKSVQCRIACVLATILVVAALAFAAVAPSEAAGAAEHTYTQGTLDSPFTLAFVDPAIVVADSGDPLLQLAPGFTPGAIVSAWSVPLDFGQPQLVKEYIGMTWTATTQHGTLLNVYYSLNGGPWLAAASGTNGYDLPLGAHGKTIAFKVDIMGAGELGPTFDDVTFTWARWVGTPSSGGGTKDGQPGRPHVPGNPNGKGTYTYPDPVTRSSVSGGGVIVGSGASGTGSVTSSASGTGSGAATSTGARTGGTSGLPLPPSSQATGGTTPVTGVIAGSAAVSGFAFRPAAGLSVGSPRLGGGRSRGGRLPLLALTAVVGGLALLLFAPWPIAAAQMRGVSSPDRLRRARYSGPFGGLGQPK